MENTQVLFQIHAHNKRKQKNLGPREIQEFGVDYYAWNQRPWGPQDFPDWLVLREVVCLLPKTLLYKSQESSELKQELTHC